MTEAIERALAARAAQIPPGEAGPLAAEAWADESFVEAEVGAWVDAGCWSPDAAAFLRHHGASPSAARIEVEPRVCLGELLSRGEIDSLLAVALIEDWRRAKDGARRPGRPPKDRAALAEIVAGLVAVTGAPVTAGQVAASTGGSSSSAAKQLKAAVRLGLLARHEGSRTYSARGAR